MIAEAQTNKTNQDRKNECRQNLNGTVVEHEGGGFTCNAGPYDASIHCTSSGECICTGSDCDKLGGNHSLGKVRDSKRIILSKLPQNILSQDKTRIVNLVEQSLNAIRSGDGKTSAEKIGQIRAFMKRNASGGPLEDCYDHCKGHLDNGNPTAYAVCYWACVVMGGPSTKYQLYPRQ
jgi:hypothetical protein